MMPLVGGISVTYRTQTLNEHKHTVSTEFNCIALKLK